MRTTTQRATIKVEVFLNDTCGGSFREDVYGTRKRATSYDAAREQGTATKRMFDDYEHGDVVCKSSLEFLRPDDDYLGLCWNAVAEANRDTRANGQTERSFSHGDTLRVTKRDGSVVWLASNGYDLIEIQTPEVIYA
jgi:hypothetical protein